MGKVKSAYCGEGKGIATKACAPTAKAKAGKSVSQPVTGKLKGMQAMAGGCEASKGGPIKTAASNPIAGAGKSSGTVMGSGDVIPGMV